MQKKGHAEKGRRACQRRVARMSGRDAVGRLLYMMTRLFIVVIRRVQAYSVGGNDLSHRSEEAMSHDHSKTSEVSTVTPVYCNLCHGVLLMDAGEREDFVEGQLIVAGLCLPIALLYLVLL
jgi:hypothetical protein